jgi:hypothetical protein
MVRAVPAREKNKLVASIIMRPYRFKELVFFARVPF